MTRLQAVAMLTDLDLELDLALAARVPSAGVARALLEFALTELREDSVTMEYADYAREVVRRVRRTLTDQEFQHAFRFMDGIWTVPHEVADAFRLQLDREMNELDGNVG